MKIDSDLSKVNIEDLKEMWDSVGWRNGSILQPERLLKDIEKSDTHIFAWDKAKLIGLITCIDDGLNVCITYMIVHKEHQNQGIGQKLLSAIIDRYGNTYKYQVCTKEAQKLYEKFGFIENVHGLTGVV